MFSKSSPSQIRPARSLIVVLSTALLLRVALVLFALRHFGPAWFFSRGSEMGFLADSLLHGAGLSSPFGIPTGPTAIVAPGYPLLVATLFYLFGSFSWPAALSLMLLHALCNLCNTITVYLHHYRVPCLPAGTLACR